jgi:hypothetical protein
MRQKCYKETPKLGKRVSLALAAVLVVLATPRPAAAYLDPASGSMILQLVLGGVAGAAVAARLFWRRLTARWRRQDGPPSATDEA